MEAINLQLAELVSRLRLVEEQLSGFEVLVKQRESLLAQIHALTRPADLNSPWARLGITKQSYDLLSQPVDSLGLTVRAQNCLVADNLHYVGDVVCRSEMELMRINNLGRRAVNEIIESLTSHGLRTRMNLDNLWDRPTG